VIISSEQRFIVSVCSERAFLVILQRIIYIMVIAFLGYYIQKKLICQAGRLVTTFDQQTATEHGFICNRRSTDKNVSRIKILL